MNDIEFAEMMSTDGRHIRIERDDSSTPTEVGYRFGPFDTRVYIDGEAVDSAGLAVRHDGNSLVLVTSVGDFTVDNG